ncbi:hypothetical protein AOT82_511 [Psychrobacter sp. AntiMn-1]|nr:hypothetical protein AOT82_511 [Psychrobacter sp. AntiMn-1]
MQSLSRFWTEQLLIKSTRLVAINDHNQHSKTHTKKIGNTAWYVADKNTI